MPSMTSLTQAPRTTLQTWHDEQQPLVRALATPMVEEMTSALDGLQEAIDTRDDLLAAVSAQLSTLQHRVVSLEKGAEEQAAQLTRQLETTTSQLEATSSKLEETTAQLEGTTALLEETTAQLEETTALLEATTAQLETTKADLTASQETVTDLTAKVEATTDRIHVLERQMFGRKSERQKKTPDARRVARKRRRNELTDEEKKKRRGDAAARRQAKLDALRTVTHTVKVPEAFRQGRQLPPVASVLYEWHPGELVRVEVSREQWIQPDDLAIVTAPPIGQVVEGGSYGPALYAKIAVDKVLNALPLRRQERMFKRLRAPMPMSTLASLFHRAGDLVHPLFEALVAHVSAAPHVSADETPMPVLDEGETHKGWMWVFAADDALLFTYSSSRGKSVPVEVLGGSVGTLTVDGYTAYNSVTGDLGRQRGGCWSHARRGLYDALEHDRDFIQPLLDDIGELFYLEELAREQGLRGTELHLAMRQERSQPVIDRLFSRLEDYNAGATDGRSSVSKAVRYVLNQREPLELFLTDAAVPIHNNRSERALRIVALLRKNSLFAGGDEPAQTYAELLSLLSTCQLHDVDPEEWLADVLLAIHEPGLIAQDLLPWNWKVTRGPGYTPYFDTR